MTTADSLLLAFDVNHDLTLGTEDRGVWFGRNPGKAESVDLVNKKHDLTVTVGPVGTRTSGGSGTCTGTVRVCIYELLPGATSWRIEAKLIPSDFKLNNFAMTSGAFLVMSSTTTPTVAAWPPSAVNPPSWQALFLEDPRYRSCLPDVINTPDTYLQPPAMDGIVDGDNGWTSAWRYSFNNGSITPDVVVQTIRNTTDLYLSFEVQNDGGSAGDLITIAYDKTRGAPGDEWQLNIKPFGAGGTAIEQWTGAYAGTVTTPAGVVVGKSGAGPPWYVEVKIPRSLVGLPAAGDFGFYFNVHPTTALGTTGEFQWPTEPSALMGTNEHVLPDPANWGKATLQSTNCNGVYITQNDIFTNHGLVIDRVAVNTFTARAHNESIDGNGLKIVANGIRATFKIARFGLPNMWSLVRADLSPNNSNPTGGTSIAPGSTSDLTFNWTLNTTEQGEYAYPNNHQCILAELDAMGAAGTMSVFANKSAWTNMQIGTASKFESEPVVDGRGYGPPPEGRTDHTFELLTVQRETTFTEPPRSERYQGDSVWRPYSLLTYLVHGCRLNGRHITIGKRTYDVCERVGSFGYLIRHEGAEAANWRISLAGRGLSESLHEAGDRHRLVVPAEAQVPLHVVIKAGREGLPWWVWVIVPLLLLFGLYATSKRRSPRARS